MDDFLGFEEGDSVVVTGAGSGIGRAVACAAADAGLRIAAWDISESAAEETADFIRERGGDVLALRVDASDADAVAGAWSTTLSALGRVRSLAAVAGPPSFLDRSYIEGVTQCIECMRLPTEAWVEADPGEGKTVVYFASVQGPRYGAGVEWYTVGKAAIDGYMKSVAAMRYGGIRANAILPDWIQTPRTAPHSAALGGPEGWLANPMGRVGAPEDCANACLFLLSPAAAYVNGVSLVIDGGQSLRSAVWLRINGLG
jgi:NAD(P)-dependent dehydrogenase (short-subunit alcohol dehydrogenase family)